MMRRLSRNAAGLKGGVVAASVERLRRTNGRGELFGQVVDALFRKADSGLLQVLDQAALEGLSTLAFDFFELAGDDINLRALNPSAEAHGFDLPYSLLLVSLKDRPFIVDSLTAALARAEVRLEHLLHPIVSVRRGEAGKLAAVGEGQPEALELYFTEPLDEAALGALEAEFRDVLEDVVAVTTAFAPLRSKTAELAERLDRQAARAEEHGAERQAEETREYADFMRWLLDDNFVFLGYREYAIRGEAAAAELSVVPGSGLGLLAREGESTYAEPVPLAELPTELRERVTGGRSLIITKTNAESTVHRPARMDYVGVKIYDLENQADPWRVRGERRLLGLFTSKALAAPTEDIPILRLRLKRVLELDGAPAGSHDHKAIRSVFNATPRDTLFAASSEDLLADIRVIIGLEQERGVRLSLRPDPLGRGLAVMVLMPRERFNAEVRAAVQAYLTDALDASHVDYQLTMSEDSSQLRFHFFFVTKTSHFDVDSPALERQVAELTRTWDDAVTEALEEAYGDAEAKRLAARYLSAFDEAYKAEVGSQTALRNIASLEALGESDYVVRLSDLPLGGAEPVPAELAPTEPIPTEPAPNELTSAEPSLLEIYHQGRLLPLSRVMPLLENLGLHVLEQLAFAARLEEATRGVDVFRVTLPSGEPLDVSAVSGRLGEALNDLLRGEAENDRLNALVLRANLSTREVALLRAYSGHFTQLNAVTSRRYVYDTLLAHPELASLIVRAFKMRFDPELDGDRAAHFEVVRTAFMDGLNGVQVLPEDTVLRGLFNLVEASVRSNYFLDKPYISFKLASGEVSSMPEPRPLYEIAVHGLNVEGVHLRGGKVARGGLRWSDRQDDYRTEVLGLMKTQMTKNAVIVPVGSKGGFVLKRAPAERDELRRFVEAQYQTYLRGLLDITDNLVNGAPVHPSGLIIHDEPDPYLVVAADKGTATFSDLANQTAAEYDFWLGDAFASGGSKGYDHKKEGITARGAWECVARHFRELSLDVHKNTFSAVGIGDMAGDVFGNGMLYTDSLKLVAAFNHLHIFLDPDPDPLQSFAERERLFALPRSSWQDYDKSLISQGGGVFERGSKRVELSPEAQTALGVEAEALSGQDLIRAILQAPVDLLWNGGIGTYVKAASETHAEAGDAANDAVRVNAEELRARVVGEGGNLGFTQRGRVAYALSGGKINTDAIDNSAGVDMSDHEVNLKIALRPLVSTGELTESARTDLLAGMTDEVSALVLADNYAQSLALSVAELRDQTGGATFWNLQNALSREAGLNPGLEVLPDAETLDARRQAGQGYTRPELAVLLAYSKMQLYAELLASERLGADHLEPYLLGYFPEVLRERQPGAIREHSLRAEITATELTNYLTDTLGPDFMQRLSSLSGQGIAAVALAAVVATELLAADKLTGRLNALDGSVNAVSQYRAYLALSDAVAGVTRWLLRIPGNAHEQLAAFSEPVAALREQLPDVLPAPEANRFTLRAEAWVAAGLSELARELAVLEYLPSAVNVLGLSAQPLEAARAFFAVGERLSLGWLRDTLVKLPATTGWDALAQAGLAGDLRRLQTELTGAFLTRAEKTSLEAFLGAAPDLLKTFDDACIELRRAEVVPYAGAQVLSEYLRALTAALSA